MKTAPRDFGHARDFERLFPNSEHKILRGHRTGPNGKTEVDEWRSRAFLYDRYVVTLHVAIEIANDRTITELESPSLDVIEVNKVEKGKQDEGGPKYELMWYRFEQGAWEELVKHSGDFSSLGFAFDTESPVDRFDVYWHDTQGD